MISSLPSPMRWANLIGFGVLTIGISFAALTVASAATEAKAGFVKGVRGEARARSDEGAVRSLGRGDPVFAGDVVNTSARSFVLLQFKDDTRFAIGQRATLEINDFAYGRKDKPDNIATRVVKGAFRFVSGLIAKRKPASMRVKLGVIATIGLRGTEVVGEVVGDSATVILQEAEDGGATGIDVSNAFGSVSIDEAGYGTEIPDANSPPSAPRRMRLRTIENLMRTLQSVGRISTPRPRPHMR